jgi:hypothetical protein
MNFKTFISCLVVLTSLFALSVNADTIDVRSLLSGKLKQHGKVLISRDTSRSCIKEEKRCDEWSDVTHRCLGTHYECVAWSTNTNENRDYLSPTSIEIKVIDEFYGEEVLAGIPDRVLVRKTTVRNCSSTSQPSSTTLSLTANQTRSVSITKGLNTGQSISVNVGVSFKAFRAGSAVAINKSVSLNESNTSSETRSASYTESVQRKVGPKTELSTSLKAIERTMMIPYTAKILLDANLRPNMVGLKKVSDIFSKADRIVNVEGYITADLASQTFLDYRERVLAESDCGDDTSKGLEITEEEQKSYDMKAISADLNLSKQKNAHKILSFIASGIHQCQSTDSIGHSCEVFGSQFANCIDAQVDLDGQDCCFATPEGGTSIGFSLNYCSPF